MEVTSQIVNKVTNVILNRLVFNPIMKLGSAPTFHPVMSLFT